MAKDDWTKDTWPIHQFETEHGWPSPRKQRLFGVACCLRVHHLLPEDEGWRESLDIAERYADKKVKRADVLNCFICRQDRRVNWGDRKRTYAQVVLDMVRTSLHWVCETHKRTYASQLARSVKTAVAYSTLPPKEKYVPPAEGKHHALWSKAEKDELRAQIELVFEICGDGPLPTLGKMPKSILGMARAAYENRQMPAGQLDPDALAVLSDALDESDLADARVLEHLRTPGPHYRGCWALDLVLGKK